MNKQQIELVESKVQETELQKGEYFAEAGKIPKRVAFVDKGILRVCYYKNNGDEITKYFIDENNFAVDINSLSQNIPSSEYVQAVTDCSLLVLSIEALNELSATIICWDDIINKIINKSLIEKVNKLSPMLSEDATTRYIEFMNRFPQLANRVPLSYIASFLGITQSSLSRIRKNIK